MNIRWPQGTRIALLSRFVETGFQPYKNMFEPAPQSSEDERPKSEEDSSEEENKDINIDRLGNSEW